MEYGCQRQILNELRSQLHSLEDLRRYVHQAGMLFVVCIPAVDSGYSSLQSSTLDPTPTPTQTPTPTPPEPVSTDQTNVITERTGEKPRLFTGKGFFLKQKAPKLLGFPDASVSEACYKRFEDLHDLFSDTIYKNLRPKYISWKPRILGEDEQRKRPYIVILCDPGSVKKLRRFFKTKEIKQQCEEAEGLPSLPVIVIASEPPFKLASLLEVFASIPTSSGSTTSGACIKIVHGDREKIATVGGIIKVVFGEETVLYGMTAGHVVNEVIDDEEEDSNSGDGGSFSSPSEDSETDFEFDEDYDTLPELDTTTIVKPDLVYSSAEVRISNLEWRPVGNILMPNDPVRGKEITDLDWALVEMADRGWPTMNAVRRDEPISIIYRAQDGRVNNRPVIFKPGGASYYLRGNINTYASYVQSPSKRATRVYSMRCCADLDRVKPGDCGTWVIDAETGLVYGHIVAVDVFDEVHVIPLEDTIEEMKRILNADEVCLPSPEDLTAMNGKTYRVPNFTNRTGHENSLGSSTDSPISRYEFINTQTSSSTARPATRRTRSHSNTTKNKPLLLKCDICGFTSNTSGSIARHKRRIHGEGGIFCTLGTCAGRRFLRADLFNEHIRRMHSAELIAIGNERVLKLASERVDKELREGVQN